MRVSLAPSAAILPPGDIPASRPGTPMLAPDGAAVILGALPEADGLVRPVTPSAASLFGPRGAALASKSGPLVVADTGHHRLLIWNTLPQNDGSAADNIIGQPDFSSEGRNGKGAVNAATLNVPTGVSIENGALAVADAWNHRVLIWTSLPAENNQPADLVLGQENFEGGEANRGGEAGPDTLNWCYSVTLTGGGLLVADTGNRRVLVWDRLPEQNGQPADRVLGQRSLSCRDENAGGDAGALGMRWPHGMVRNGSKVYISDAGNNRIMIWNGMPEAPGAPCGSILGQTDAVSLEHNRGRYLPDAASLNMPYSIVRAGKWLIAADTANSRLIGWTVDDLAGGAHATGLAGQLDFTAKGDNRWQMAARDSLCWPYGLGFAGTTLAIADSGNNRVLLWELAS